MTIQVTDVAKEEIRKQNDKGKKVRIYVSGVG